MARNAIGHIEWTSRLVHNDVSTRMVHNTLLGTIRGDGSKALLCTYIAHPTSTERCAA